MKGRHRHIVGATGTGEPNPGRAEDFHLYRTCTWALAEAPDDPNVVAIVGMTPHGKVGLEFPKSEARELARRLAALTQEGPVERH